MKYFLKRSILLACVFFFHFSFASNASDIKKIIDDFTNNPERRWQFYTDQVMGGVSEGTASVRIGSEGPYLRLEGLVSTDNNGGFIQFRANVKIEDLPYKGLKINTRGNGEEYFIHIRTPKTRLPWNYYASSFTVSSEWQSIKIPFDSFKKSGLILPRKFDASDIKSIGIVAFGKDFYADIDLASIELY